METILDILPVGVFLLDAKFQVAEVNSIIAKYFGISQIEMIGQDKRKLIFEKISGIFEDGGKFRSRVLATYDDNTYIECFVCHILAGSDREERWLEHNSQPILTGKYKGGRIEIYRDVTDRILAEKEIQWITTHSMQLLEKEKAKIAGNLHDELGQTVLAIRFSLDNLQESLMKHPNLFMRELNELQKSIERVRKLGFEISNISSNLMPPLLGPLGLEETLTWLKDQYSSLYGFDIHYQSLGMKGKRFPEYLEVTVFRVFQESLNNIVKHASANNIELKIIYSHPKLIMSITDDGKGFNPENHIALGVGLKIMKQRILELDGKLKITSEIDKGTTIRAEITVTENNDEKI
jgi:PAS domain S-box-containing protein